MLLGEGLALGWWPSLWKHVQLLKYLRKQSIRSGFKECGERHHGLEVGTGNGAPARKQLQGEHMPFASALQSRASYLGKWGNPNLCLC